MRVAIVAMLVLMVLLTATTFTLTVSALNAGNIDLTYYNTTTHKPIYEVQFLTVPLAYESGRPNVIVYRAGTNFSIQVTNYESSKGGVIVKLINIYDGTEKVVGWLNKGEVTNEFEISNLYPGCWKMVIVGTDGLPTWDLSNPTAPTNAGPHEIKIVGSPKLIIALMNPSKNITIGDYARLKIEVKGLYGTTTVNVDVKSQHTIHYSRELGGINGSIWILNIPTDKLGIGKCEVVVKAMDITGNISFNIVPVKVNFNTNVSSNTSANESANETKMVGKTSVNMSTSNVTKMKENTTKRNNASVSENETGFSSKKEVNASAKVTVNRTANKATSKKEVKTPGFGGLTTILGLSALVVLRKFRF